jgi:hypothetical protein
MNCASLEIMEKVKSTKNLLPKLVFALTLGETCIATCYVAVKNKKRTLKPEILPKTKAKKLFI